MNSIAVVDVPRRRSSRWLLLGLLALAMLLAMALVYQQIGHWSGTPVSVVVDGDEVLQGWDFANWAPMEKALVAGSVMLGLLVALAVMLVVVPMTLLLVAGLVMLVLLSVFGLPLLLVGGVVLLVLSPLLALGLLSWWLLKALL